MHTRHPRADEAFAACGDRLDCAAPPAERGRLMGRNGLRTVEDVAALQLCTGCGGCAFVSPERYTMVDALTLGRRPVRTAPASDGDGDRGDGDRGDGAGGGSEPDAAERDAMAVCPGHELVHGFDREDPELRAELVDGWGPVYEVWEGYAADPVIRRMGSSGGAATALSLYALEAGGMHGVLHTAAQADRPYLNETVLSTTRDDLLAASGSRYAPASPCDGLQRIVDAPGPCAFVGKPCDVAAVQSARKLREGLDAKLGLVVAFFCAGAPSTQGTLDLLRKVGVEDPSSVISLRYRGNGWPGSWTVRFRTESGEEERSLSYADSWGFLQSRRQWRCYICPDHTGEFADIAVGDPWYRPVEEGEDGKSLLVVRTKRGREVLHAAVAAGYIVLETSDPTLLPRSQPNLLGTRASMWGRITALRLAGAPWPRYVGFPAFRFWLGRLSFWDKLRSVTGTLRRVGRKRLKERVRVEAWEGPPREP